MLRDYLRAFWRGVLHNKVATLINVGGLALGLTVFFALEFYVYREFSWDEQWEDADRIYLASGALETATPNATPVLGTQAPYVLGTTLLSRYPEVFETYARLFSIFGTVVMDGEDKGLPMMSRYHAEPALLDLLQLETVEGSLEEVFADPRAIAIEARLVERLFGSASPLGHTLTFKPPENQGAAAPPPQDFVIRAVYSLPQPSTFNLAFLALLDTSATLPQPFTRLDLWQSVQPTQPLARGERPLQPFNVAHYFKLREGVDVRALETDLRAFMDANRLMDSGIAKTRFMFRNIQDLHLAPSSLQVGDNVQRLWVYAAIGLLVLLISGCNFVMLATLRLVDRMREVGIRKSVGGGGGQLLRQYLLDAFLHVLLAASLAVLFLGFVYPRFSVMLQINLPFEVLTPRNLLWCLAMAVLFTLVSSLYPAWLSSQTKPGPLLRNGAGAVVGTGTGLRKLLVGLQFAIVVVLLLASTVVRQQIEFTRTRDTGYSVENVISIRGATDMARTRAVMTEFRKVDGVEAAAWSSFAPGLITNGLAFPIKALAADGSMREAALGQKSVGADFFKVMSVRILAGREFSDLLDAPTSGVSPAAVPAGPQSVVLNEAAVRALGFASPELAVGQLLEREFATPDGQSRTQSLRVIGVVADTQFSSAMVPPVPEYFNYSAAGFIVSVKIAAGESMAAISEDLRAIWDEAMNGTSPFIVQDLGALSTFMLQREEYEARLISASTLLAIAIALLGLYGLVAATVVKRVKEIGVRKVMGAERKSIVTLFLWQFSQPIVIANLLAWPFGFWAIKQWLTRFPYQLDTGMILLSGLLASIAALLIAWLTVGVMAAKAASVKPVVALRYE